jgi:translocation and assembly module TamB
MDDGQTPAPTPPDAPAPPPKPRRSRRRRWAWGLSGATVAAIAAAVLVPLALLSSEPGTIWLMQRLPGLSVEAPRGALLGDSVGAERLTWEGMAGQLELEGLAVTGMRWSWRPAPGQWLGLRADGISVRLLRWKSAGGGGPGVGAPVTLRLPVALAAPVKIERAEIDTLAPLLGLKAAVEIGADGGASHRVQGLALTWDRLRAAGSLQLATDAPFALQAALDAGSLEGAAQPWQAAARAEGPLGRMAVTGRLRGLQDAAALDLTASVTPFAPWPLAALSARTQALDLARLASGLPQTAFDGQADLRSSASDAPFEAMLAFDNRLPGRWNEGRLPLRRATATLRARLAEPGRVQIEAFALQLGDATATAGSWQGAGEWSGNTLTLDAQAQGLTPQRLDTRAASMQLGGTVKMTLSGLPSPDPQAATPPPAWSLAVLAKLQGRLEAAPVPVQWSLDFTARQDELVLRSLQARAGAAEASAQATLRRTGSTWALASEGRLAAFDPLPWFPGTAGSIWSKGPHRLEGEWTVALTLPDTGKPGTDRWRQLGGQASVRLAPSVLAGVPLQGQATLSPGQQAGQPPGLTLQAEMDAAGNRVAVNGRFDPLGDGRADRWQIDLKAPALTALAPLAALEPALTRWIPREGRADAAATLQGRWPALQGQGQASAQGVRAGPLALGQATLQWQFTDQPEQPLSARLAVTDFAYGTQRVPALDATLEGSMKAHRLRAQAALPVVPPTALVQTLALKTQKGTRVALQGDGSLQRDATGAIRWAGQLERLSAGGWDGRLPLTEPAPRDWLNAGPVRAELALDADGRLQRLRADAGRLQLAGELAMTWEEVRYDAGTLQLRAKLESFRVAPLLARWQPAFGWEGELRMGASIDIRAGERFDADLVFERLGGDLQVREGANAPLPLGLTDLRVALNAHDGTWYFTQALAGRTLGELGGVLRVTTAPASRWPEPTAPVDGSVRARVANLGVWGAWVPAGWRLEGMLETTARFSGKFANPEVTGALSGSGLGVRNLLQGVQVTDGNVLVRLEGSRANIERFRFKAGDGTLTLTGGADLGAAPEAQLALQAERFQVLGRIDRRLVASGRADLTLKPLALTLKGGFTVDEGLFDASRGGAPALDDDVTVRRSDEPEPDDSEAKAARQQRAFDVALDIDLGRKLQVRGRGLDTLLTGKLRVSAPGGRLAVNGTVNAERGTYAAYGQKLEIERGLIAFSGAVENPRLDVLALRPNLDIEVGVAVTGTAQSPRIRLHSNPELSDTDKLSWLVLGRDPAGLGRTDTALLQRAAVALLAGEGEAPTDALIRSLGLDEVSVRQSDGEVSETIVTLGKQLSRRWYVGYERGVNSTVGTWQLIYRVAQRFTLRAQSGAENSLDVIWVWRVP